MDKLSQKALEARREYNREYRRKNPEKIRKHINDYWERKAENRPIDKKVKDLHGQGYTQRGISKALDISLGAVNKYLNAD